MSTISVSNGFVDTLERQCIVMLQHRMQKEDIVISPSLSIGWNTQTGLESNGKMQILAMVAKNVLSMVQMPTVRNFSMVMAQTHNSIGLSHWHKWEIHCNATIIL